MQDKGLAARLQRARRAATRQELVLKKARLFDPRATLYNTYGLLDENGNWVAWGHQKGFGLTLDEVECALEDRPTAEHPFVRDRRWSPGQAS